MVKVGTPLRVGEEASARDSICSRFSLRRFQKDGRSWEIEIRLGQIHAPAERLGVKASDRSIAWDFGLKPVDQAALIQGGFVHQENDKSLTTRIEAPGIAEIVWHRNQVLHAHVSNDCQKHAHRSAA